MLRSRVALPGESGWLETTNVSSSYDAQAPKCCYTVDQAFVLPVTDTRGVEREAVPSLAL